MKNGNVRLTSLIALTAALVAVLAYASVAGAKAHRPCSLGAGPLTPTLSFPCNRPTVHRGRNFTFTVLDHNSKAHRYKPFIELTSKKPDKHRRLPSIPGPVASSRS